MNVGIYKSASAMVALDRWQQAISQNLAAAQVPGYRKNQQVFEAKPLEGERSPTATSGASARGAMPTATSQISFQPGEIRTTGNDTDFAIQGPGFFKIQRAPGEVGYTRDGEFHIGPNRTLQTKQGFAVLGDAGPITLRPEGGRLSINADGSLVQGEIAVGRLPIFQFADSEKMRRMGDGLLGPEDPKVQPRTVATPEIVGGVLEMSNVQPLQEMVNMITVSRAYEANQRLITAQDESLSKAIQILGSA